MADKFDLQRFVDAQDRSYRAALSELRAGSKRSHWMWFVFPQAAGLGHSPMAIATASVRGRKLSPISNILCWEHAFASALRQFYQSKPAKPPTRFSVHPMI
jgi:uncharacterized protein (DUF1810 family)